MQRRQRKKLPIEILFLTAVLICVLLQMTVPTMAAAFSEKCTISGANNDGAGKYYVDAGWFSAGTADVTITNSSSENRVYTIEYDVTIGSKGGSVTINGTTHSSSVSGQSCDIAIDTGKTTTINLSATKAGIGGSNQVSITFISITDVLNVTADVKFASFDADFASAAVGSYTISGVTASNYIDKDVALTCNASTGVTVSAASVSGYDFIGWIKTDTNELLSTEQTATLRLDENCTVSPVYAPSNGTVGIFLLNGCLYSGWDAAFGVTGNNTVVLINDYTLTAGQTYSVPQGKKLLIPYSMADANAGGNFDLNPDMHLVSKSYYDDRSPYKTLTIPDGAELNCSGEICVDSKIFADTIYSGAPQGDFGKILLQEGGALNIKNGGTMYAYGYITGDWDSSSKIFSTGTVTVENGGTLIESFQALGWRGGTIMGMWLDNKDVKSFGFADYALQNVESNLIIQKGGTVNFVVSLEADSSVVQTSGTFVGASSGFLQMGENSIVTRTYDPYNNRINYALDGNASVANLIMSIPDFGDLDTKNYILGINTSMDIVINSDANITMMYDLKLMPGATVTVKKDGCVTINQAVYIYDTADFVVSEYYGHTSSYTHIKSIPVPYICATGYKSEAYSNTFNKGISQMSTSTPSAKVVIDGTLTIGADGGLYTSSNGGKSANKVITGTGTIINQSTVATGIVTDALDEPQANYHSTSEILQGKYTNVADLNKVVTPAVGLIAGLSTSDSDYKCFEANGAIYHGTESGYWYEYVVESENTDIITNESVASDSTTIPMTVTASDGTKSTGASTNAVGIVGNGSSITFDSSTNVASTIAAENGTFTFSTNPSCATVTKDTTDEQGTLNTATTPYTLTGVTADTTLSFTVAHADQGDLTCTCGAKLFKLVSMNAAADARTDLILTFQVHESLASEDAVSVSFEGSESTEVEIEVDAAANTVTVTQPVASGLMTQNVVVSFKDGTNAAYAVGTSDTSISRSIVDYARLVLQQTDSNYDAAKELVTAMVIYGGYAQTLFDVDAENPAYMVLKDFLTADQINALHAAVSGVSKDNIKMTLYDTLPDGFITGENAKPITQNVVLDSAIEQTVYFYLQDGFTLSGTVELSYITNVGGATKVRTLTPMYDTENSRYYVTIKNIPAALLNYDYTITGKVNGKEFTITPSIASYMQRVIESGGDIGNTGENDETKGARKSLVQAMWLYNQAAYKFFSQGIVTEVSQ